MEVLDVCGEFLEEGVEIFHPVGLILVTKRMLMWEENYEEELKKK